MAVTNMPERYGAIRSGIADLLKIGEIRRRSECEFNYDGRLLGDRAPNR